MLTSLTIKNYALIEELQADFERGLNVITGETGAGKSIIIGALGLVLGERADADAVRQGADKAVVEGTLECAGNRKLKRLLEEHETEWGDEIILRREVSARGQSRCFINDTPAPLSLLKQAGDLLVDLHGQHEHQSLLRTDAHRDALDGVGGLEGLVEEFGESYRAATALLREREELRSRERQLADRKSLYEFQMQEIDEVGPEPGEEERLESELRILEHAEQLFGATERLYRLLYEGEGAVHDQLVMARNDLEGLAAIDGAFADPAREAASAAAIVDELAKFIQAYNSKIEFAPERLEALRERLGRLAGLKKKYGGSADAVVAYRETIGREAALADNFQQELESLDRRFGMQREACSDIARRLSSKRSETAKRLGGAVAQALAGLGIPRAEFEVRITRRPARDEGSAVVKMGRDCFEAGPKGIDDVEFLVSANPGEAPRPLAKVASGGEISRIMLALKTIVAKADRLPLMVFDEIDVGVSGRVAHAVGLSLKSLSKFHQVVSITHLPQIAGLADAHFLVEKSERGGRAFTRLRKLELEERVREVAALMSGTEVTDSGLAGARELIGLAGKGRR